MTLPPSSATSFPFHPREGEGGTGTFLHKRKEKKKQSFFSGGGLVGFFCLSEAVGLKFSFPYTHTHAHMYTLGITGQPGPTPAGVFLLGSWASTHPLETWP